MKTNLAKNRFVPFVLALLLAALLCAPALAQDMLPPVSVTVSWDEGETRMEMPALPVAYPEYPDAFWLQVSPDIMAKNPMVTVTDDMGARSEQPLSAFLDSGSSLASTPSMEMMLMDEQGQPVRVLYIYLSSVSAMPDAPDAAQPVDVLVYFLDQYNPDINVAQLQFVKCFPGENFVVANPQNLLPGYELVSPEMQTVFVDSVGASPSVVTFLYANGEPQPVQPVEVRVYFRDANGNEIATAQTQVCSEGENVIYPNPFDLQDNYVPADVNPQTVMVDANGASPSEVTFYYYYSAPAVQPVDVFVHYRDMDGNEVATAQTQTCYEGSNTIYPNPMDLRENFVPADANPQTVMVDANGASPSEVTFYYYYSAPAVQPVDVFVYYRDMDGNEVATAQTQTCYEGSNTIYPNPMDLRENFVPADANPQTVMVDANGASPSEVTFYYYYSAPAVQPVDVYVYYRDMDGNEVATAQTQTCYEGSNTIYPNPMDLRENFVPADANPQTVMVDANGASPSEVTFYYYYSAPVVQPVDVYVHYRDMDGNEVAGTQTQTCYEGSNTIYPNPMDLRENFVPADANPQTVTVDANGASPSEVTFYYYYSAPVVIAAPQPVNVFFRDELGNDVATQVTRLCDPGATLIIAEPADLRADYFLISEDAQTVVVDENGANPGEVVFLYEYRAPVDAQPAPKVAFVRVSYINQTGALLFSEDVTCVQGADNPIDVDISHVPEYCTLDDAPQKFVAVDENGFATPTEVTFLFRDVSAISALVTVRYLDIEGQSVADARQEPCYLGANSIAANPDNLLPGYTLTSPDAQTVTLSQTGMLTPGEIVFYYERAQQENPYNVVPMDSFCYPKNDDINFRSAPVRESGNILRSVSRSDLMRITGYLDNDEGERWYQAEYREEQGYLMSSVVRLLTDAEIAALMGYTPTPEPEKTPEPTAVPEGVPLDIWGETVTKVNFRSTTSTKDIKNLITELKAGSKLFIYEAVTVGGKKWYSAIANGKSGYIVEEFVQLMDRRQSDLYQAQLASPAPTTAIATVAPTDAPVTVPPITIAPSTMVPPLETATPMPDAYEGYAVTLYDATLYTDAGLLGTGQALLPADTLVYVNSQTYVDNVCYDYVYVSATDFAGFLPDGALERVSIEVANVYLASLRTTEAPTQAPEPETGYAVTLGADGAPLRRNPDLNASIEVWLPADGVVNVVGQQYENGVKWHLAQYAGAWGFVRGDMVRLLDDWEEINYLESLKTATPTVQAVVTPGPVTPTSLSCWGCVTRDYVRLRKGPSTKSEEMDMLNKNSALSLIIWREDNEEGGWYKVLQDGREGYVFADYMQVLTVDEVDDYLSSPEYLDSTAYDNASASGSGTLTSFEEFTVGVWTNPSLAQASYEPFSNPLLTATPDFEAIATPTVTPTIAPPIAPINPTQPPVTTVETSSFPTGWVVGALALLGLSGCGYAYAIKLRNDRRAAERAARRRQMMLKQTQEALQQAQQAEQRARAYTPRSQQAPDATRRAQPIAAPIIPPQGSVPGSRPSQMTGYSAQGDARRADAYPPNAAPIAPDEHDTRMYSPEQRLADVPYHRNRRAGRKS